MEEPGILLEEEIEIESQKDIPWNVILYNDNIHSFEEVIFQIQKATGFSMEKAIEITFEAHNKGRAICYSGPLEKCTQVANILKEIHLQVEIDQPAGF